MLCMCMRRWYGKYKSRGGDWGSGREDEIVWEDVG